MNSISMRAYVINLGCSIALTIAFTCAQDTDSRVTSLRNLHLPELPGSVPTIYVPSAKERALRYQAELQNACAWFEEQLRIRAPMILAVLDREPYQGQGGHWPLPHSRPLSNPGIVYFPDRVEELVGPEPQARTPGEYIAYHEAGHIFAARLKTWSGNAFVNELIANVFMAAYIREKRPDLQWVLAGPSARHFGRPQRYTSLADMDYVYSGMGPENYAWFQYHLQRIGSFLLTGQPFPSVMEKFKGEFPAATPKQETLDRIIAHLDRIRPGVMDTLGTLAGPTTLSALKPSACSEPAKDAPQTTIAIRNDTTRPLILVTPKGSSETVAPQSWSRFDMKSSESMKLPDGTCLVAGDEPALAVIDKQ